MMVMVMVVMMIVTMTMVAIRSHTILSTPDFLPQIGRESNNGAPLVRELPIIPDIIKLS